MQFDMGSMDERLAEVRERDAWEREHPADPRDRLVLRNFVLPYLAGIAPFALTAAVLRAAGLDWIAWIAAGVVGIGVRVAVRKYLARPLTDAQLAKFEAADRRFLAFDPQHLTKRQGFLLGALPFVSVLLAGAIVIGIDAIRR
jgi:hypothetical protein